MSKNGIIFDLDGTMWDATGITVPAWNRVLCKYKDYGRELTQEEMESYMGKTLEEIAQAMFPAMPVSESVKILLECCKEEQAYIRQYGGKLYDDLENTLIELKKNYNLYIVSNCDEGYIESFLEYHKLGYLFDDFEMNGRTGKPKGDNITLLMKRNQIEKAVYVGDTNSDYLATQQANIPFIFAEYGFGNVENPDYKIKCVSELPITINQIFV